MPARAHISQDVLRAETRCPVLVAGSLLGVALNRGADADGQGGVSWPVGKVDYLDLYPMTFLEFFDAMGEEGLANLVRGGSFDLVSAMGEKYEDLLRIYLYVGGMPEAVARYVGTSSLKEARAVQEHLIRDYEYDFSKHVASPIDTERIRETWRSVPTQIMLDTGLLGAALRLPEKVIIEGDALFAHAKGAYAEQYVCQQLMAYGGSAPYYWSADGKKSKAEVDFLCDYSGTVIPVEVKAERNVSSTSLGNFAHNYGIKRCVRLSLLGYKDQGWLVNLPLYAADALMNLPAVPEGISD